MVTSEPPQHSEPGRHEVALEITGPDGHAVTAYDVEHEKQLHLIVVRRDFTGFQHVHPVLVALREGDLAYLHVHPEDEPGLVFTAAVPSPGGYRLFLDFKHDDTVRTAELALTAGGEHGH